MVLKTFLELCCRWRSVFSQERTFEVALRQAVGTLCTMGRRTITRIIWFSGREQEQWSTDYRLFSRSPWKTDELFQPVVAATVSYSHSEYIGVALDDTSLHKTGRKIESASYYRDPLSPPFHVNLGYGLRFLQASALLPLYREGEYSARGIPVRFTEVPVIKKPGKRASCEDQRMYRELKKQRNLSTFFVETMENLRRAYDEAGAHDKTLIIAGDGSFCNSTTFSAKTPRTDLLARCRKDASLCYPAPAHSRRFYGTEKFTPEQVRHDEHIPWHTTRIFHGGCWRMVRYKEVKPILWQRGARRSMLRCMVVAPVAYRTTKKGKLYYRQPSYLLTTALDAPAAMLIQIYFDRWQIEVNHREEKDTLGIGQAQVRSTQSVPRQPAFAVAAYSMLLLAGLLLFGPGRTDEYLPLPKWRKKARRASCLDLVTLLRKDIVEHPDLVAAAGIVTNAQTMVTTGAA